MPKTVMSQQGMERNCENIAKKVGIKKKLTDRYGSLKHCQPEGQRHSNQFSGKHFQFFFPSELFSARIFVVVDVTGGSMLQTSFALEVAKTFFQSFI